MAWRTVNRKKVMKCKPLSLWPYDGIFCVESPRYAAASSRRANEARDCWLALQ